MLTAEYGGSGGRPIETGMVVEEPDIEIGAGVSSKGEQMRSLEKQRMTDLFQQPSADGLPPTRAVDAARYLLARNKTARDGSAKAQVVQARAAPGARQTGMHRMPMSACRLLCRGLGSRSRGCPCCHQGS